MNYKIQPEYKEINVTCSCGNKFTVPSTLCKDLHVDICSKCHPFFTGQQRVMDTAGRIDRFNKKFARKARKPGADNK